MSFLEILQEIVTEYPYTARQGPGGHQDSLGPSAQLAYQVLKETSLKIIRQRLSPPIISQLLLEKANQHVNAAEIKELLLLILDVELVFLLSTALG